MSAESMKRICEVLDEEPALKNPENPVFEVKDGSVLFDNVNFILILFWLSAWNTGNTDA